MGKPEGKRSLGRRRCSWVDNIKMDLREIGWDGMDWIYLTQNRNQWRALMNTVMNPWVPQNDGKILISCTIGGFSRKAQPCELVSGGDEEEEEYLRLLKPAVYLESQYPERVSDICMKLLI
jgi:hypothetical protein